jgi:cell division protein FtsX
VLWLSVALMRTGTALIGGGVVTLSMDTTTAIVLFIAGATLAVVGVVIGLANNIKSNVE